MDTHEDDITVLSESEEDQLMVDSDYQGPSPFALSSTEIPASTHALQAAYKDLRKRFNDLEHKNRALRRQARENSILRMSSENFLPGNNWQSFDMGEQAAAAMADHSTDDQVKQLTRQLSMYKTKCSALEGERNHIRQKFNDFREKHANCFQRDKLQSELDRLTKEKEDIEIRHSQEVSELKQRLESLTLERGHRNGINGQSSIQSEPWKHQEPSVVGRNPGILQGSASKLYPSSFPGQKKGGVVSTDEFLRVKGQMEQCLENMAALRKVVEQQSSLIQRLQSDRMNTDSTGLVNDWDMIHIPKLSSSETSVKKAGFQFSDLADSVSQLSDVDPLSGRVYAMSHDWQITPRQTSPRPHPGIVTVADSPSQPVVSDVFSDSGSTKLMNISSQPEEFIYRQSMTQADHSAVAGSNNAEIPIARERAQPTEDYLPPSPRVSGMKICPVCAKNFNQLSMGDFQNHVFDCYDNTESGEIVRTDPLLQGSAGVASPSQSNPQDQSANRVCPLCDMDFHSDIPQDVFERHVHEHFIAEEFTLLDN